ncbi:Oidioi.mRNA.OKI2018_I69.XSR.g13267.t1.cds [Oikopleura dioica]|uniref:Oidioi.mRNA.OKI2018_I69.XSR.g13267.t1.cds n=1 Tax=Oikopleura dioica TaxID=34765 RepID=A0ABN7SBK5_OIKDI|nr:Oidioi.mRNA.OKI2018_I69.XSR.g13267.t1.cds [Oikopleura dioica]
MSEEVLNIDELGNYEVENSENEESAFSDFIREISAPLAVAIPAIAGVLIACVILFCYKAFIDKMNTPVGGFSIILNQQ